MSILLSTEALAIVLLGAAFVLSCYAQLPSRWAQFILPTLTGWIPLMIFCLWLMGDGVRYFQRDLPRRFTTLPTATTFLFTAACGLAIGLVVLPIVGLWRRRIHDKRVPIAARWSILKLMAGAAACVVLLIVTIAVYDVHLRGRIAEQLAASRLTIKRLKPVPVPPEQDAAPLLKEAAAILQTEGVLPEWWNKSREPGFDVAQPEVATFLAFQSRTVEMILEASQRPIAHFTWVDGDPTSVADSDELSVFERIRALLVLSTRHRAASGDMSGCLERLAALRRLARQRSSPPAAVWCMMKEHLEWARLEAIEAMLADDSLRRAAIPLPLSDDGHTYRDAMLQAVELQDAKDMELICRSAVGDLDEWLFDGQPPRRGTRPAELLLSRVSMTVDDLEGHPVIAALAQAALRAPPYEAADAHEGLSRMFEKGSRGMVSSTLAILYEHIGRSPSRADFAARLGDLGLAIAAWKARHGALPTNLGELVPEFIDRVPVDPFDGQPMKMTPDNGGYVVHGSELEWMDINRDPVLCLGGAYQKRRVEAAAENSK